MISLLKKLITIKKPKIQKTIIKLTVANIKKKLSKYF